MHKTSHVKGSMHDYSLYKHSHPPHLPDNVCLDLDLGYLGIRVDCLKLNCMLPFKKKNFGRGKRGVNLQWISMRNSSSASRDPYQKSMEYLFFWSGQGANGEWEAVISIYNSPDT
jgi:hypothetical protein